MKVLVLGGNGLFGRKTVIRLARDPEVSTVVAMDVSNPKDWVVKAVEKNADKVHFVRGDISDIEDILSAIRTYELDRIVNWAFLLPGVLEGAPPRLGVKVNALGMCNSFEAARLMGINRVIYASSAGVYGPQHEYGDRDVTEDDMMHAQGGYALMKQFSEIIAAQYTERYGINFSALRPTIGYGHGGMTPMVVKWFSDIASLPAIGETFKIDADGTSKSSLASADDVAEMTAILLKMEKSPHSAYNVGGPPTSLLEAADAVRKYIPEARIEFGSQAPVRRMGGPPSMVSMDRVKEDLGYTLLSLEEAILVHINDARLEAGLEPIKG